MLQRPQIRRTRKPALFRFPLLLAVLLVGTGAALTQAPPPTLKIEGPWLRATPKGASVAAGYVTVTNTGRTPEKLTGATVPFAARVDVHEMAMTGGVMTMRALPNGLEIAPGQTVELKPGSNHLMFEKLSAPLTEGQSVEGTLLFEKAGSIPVLFRVGGLGGAPPAPAAASSH